MFTIIMTRFPSSWLSFTYKPYFCCSKPTLFIKINALKHVPLVQTFFRQDRGNGTQIGALAIFVQVQKLSCVLTLWYSCGKSICAIYHNDNCLDSTEVVERRWLGDQHEKNLDDCQRMLKMLQSNISDTVSRPLLVLVLSTKHEHGPCELQ